MRYSPRRVDRSDAVRNDRPIDRGTRVAMLYARHFDDVWRWLDALGVRRADLEDAAHEVFLAAHQGLDQFQGRSKLSTWLFGICANVASNLRRRAHVRREVCDDDALRRSESGAVPADESAARAQQRELLHRILDELDEPRRVAFVLYELEGMTGAAIGELLGVPMQTVYSRLHSARRFVEAEVARHTQGAR